MKLIRIASLAGALVAACACASAVQAASISYYLDQSNTESAWPDGVNYLQVTISDSIAHPGDIEFTVTTLNPLNSVAGDNFGIQKFGFNTTGAGAWLVPSDIVDPSGWTASENGTMDGFGSYQIEDTTTGSHRLTTLTFRITGVSGDTISNYAVAEAGGVQGAYYFAAHVAGMTIGGGSAYFGGNTPVTTPVPVPAAVWLLGSALGLLGCARRRSF